MNNTAGVFLHGHVHNRIKSSALFGREVKQPGAADRGRKWCVNLAAYITWLWLQHLNTVVSSHHHKVSWHVRRCLLREWHHFFTGRYLFSPVFFFSFCRLLRVIGDHPPPAPLARGGIQLGIPCSTSPGFLRTLYKARRIKSKGTTKRLTRTFAFTHASSG